MMEGHHPWKDKKKMGIKIKKNCAHKITTNHFTLYTASNLCLLLQKEQNVKGGEGPSGKLAVGINNGTR